MIKIEVFGVDAERVSAIADMYKTNNAFVLEAMFDFIEHEAMLMDTTVEDLLEDYLG